MSIAREIVSFAIEAGSSDIHLEEESSIAVRVNSDIKVSSQKLDSEDTLKKQYSVLEDGDLNPIEESNNIIQKHNISLQ